MSAKRTIPAPKRRGYWVFTKYFLFYRVGLDGQERFVRIGLDLVKMAMHTDWVETDIAIPWDQFFIR